MVLSFVISFLGVGFTVGFSEGPVFHQVLMNAAFLFFICVVNALTVNLSPDTNLMPLNSKATALWLPFFV